VQVMPKGATQTEITAEWLFEEETLNDPAYDMANVVDFATLVMEQDGDACEMNQLGLNAAPFKEGVLMPEEYLLKRFHDWVRDKLRSA
jgi:Rieske 2Fe-2S family protein